jgi:hypothetical protein
MTSGLMCRRVVMFSSVCCATGRRAAESRSNGADKLDKLWEGEVGACEGKLFELRTTSLAVNGVSLTAWGRGRQHGWPELRKKRVIESFSVLKNRKMLL